MRTWKHYVTVFAGTGAIAILLVLAGTNPLLAQKAKDVTALIVNDASAPVPVKVLGADDGSKDVFRHDFAFQFGGAAGGCAETVAVPSGRRLVVEYASLSAELGAADKITTVQIRPPSGAEIFATIPTLSYGSTNGLQQFMGSQPMKLYIDNSFTVCVLKAQAADAAFFHVEVWGYMVDRP